MAERGWGECYLVQDELRLASDGEVDAVEAALGVRLPGGYREFVTTLGAGVMGGILRVFAPDPLEGRQELYREVTEDAWFFEPDETLTMEDALESIAIADSLDGDWVIFHPGTGRLHVLPRHDERTYSVGSDLWEVVAWFQESGVLNYPHPFRYFESFAGRVEAVNGFGPNGAFGQMTEAIESLGLHDVMETTRDHHTLLRAGDRRVPELPADWGHGRERSLPLPRGPGARRTGTHS